MKILVTEQQIAQRVKELGAEISDFYEGKPEMFSFICIIVFNHFFLCFLCNNSKRSDDTSGTA